MIKLEDLKKDDIIYRVCDYHWIEKIKIISNLEIFYYQDITDLDNHIYYIQGISNFKLNSNIRLFKKDEEQLFRQYSKAKDYFNKSRQKKIEYLKKDNNLLEELYREANKMFSTEDTKLYKELIKTCTVQFK